MKSIQTKFIILILSCVFVCSAVIGGAGIISAERVVDEDSAQMMNYRCSQLACEVDAMLSRIEQSVKTLAVYTDENLESVELLKSDGTRKAFTEQIESVAVNAANNTEGAVAVYVRYNPDFTPPTSGVFWSKTNLNGTFFLSKTVAKYMIQNGIKGNILNIASSSSLRPAASAYTFSKWGIRGFTLGLAKTLAPYGITVNGLAPGPTATPMLHRDGHDITFEKNPMGRFAMPEEIANMAAVLVSDIGRMVVGDIVYMTGGAGVITYDDIEYKI